jgi:hypothetical protein
MGIEERLRRGKCVSFVNPNSRCGWNVTRENETNYATVVRIDVRKEILRRNGIEAVDGTSHGIGDGWRLGPTDGTSLIRERHRIRDGLRLRNLYRFRGIQSAAGGRQTNGNNPSEDEDYSRCDLAPARVEASSHHVPYSAG